jgi:hypothetical protein
MNITELESEKDNKPINKPINKQNTNIYPKLVFIVPYRDRLSHKIFFSQYMTFNLKSRDDYEIYFSHQDDKRPFNRGAAKNIGFMAIKHKYPDHYKKITFVFNDIDTIPFTNLFDYETTLGTVKHFYGFDYALGGIISIKGNDFEKINGFPNYWGWGMEDAILQKRCEMFRLKIDRSHFYSVGSPEILHLFDGVSRIINKKETKKSKNDNGLDGIKTLYKVKYYIDTKSSNKEDDLYIVNNKSLFMINILDFYCSSDPENEKFYDYDLREPTSKIINTEREKNFHQLTNSNWAKIPFYPTLEEKKEMIKTFGLNKTNELIDQTLNA